MRAVLVLIGAALLCGSGTAVAALPAVAVVDGPVASRWLTTAGIQHADLTSEQLAAGALRAVQILVLPVERVRTPAMAQTVIDFVRRGGSVIAVYWGPLVRSGAESTQACYALPEILGARPVGWRGTGPVVVHPEATAPRTEMLGSEIAIPRGILVTLQPAAETQVLARWAAAPPARAPAPPNGAAAAPARAATPASGSAPPAPDAAVVRAGTVVFTGIDLFAAPNDTPSVRQLFLWLVDQLTPSLAFEQAHERVSAAMAAVIHADANVDEAEKKLPSVNFAPVRQLLDQARDAAAQAKERVVKERYHDAGLAVDQSRSLLAQALQLLEKLTSKSP